MSGIYISAVKLKKIGTVLSVEVETKYGWLEVIRDTAQEGTISHICEIGGLRKAVAQLCETLAYDDLQCSGGFPEAKGGEA